LWSVVVVVVAVDILQKYPPHGFTSNVTTDLAIVLGLVSFFLRYSSRRCALRASASASSSSSLPKRSTSSSSSSAAASFSGALAGLMVTSETSGP
jgi:hypothetical protein